jgi:hypothetical protein
MEHLAAEMSVVQSNVVQSNLVQSNLELRDRGNPFRAARVQYHGACLLPSSDFRIHTEEVRTGEVRTGEPTS